MKMLNAIALALFLGSPLFAQETLLDSNVAVGGFGGPSVRFTSIAGKFGALVGGTGGIVIGHALVLGGAGYGLVNDVAVDKAPAATPYLDFGYGGGYLQYVYRSDDRIHVGIGALIGAGGASYGSRHGESSGAESNDDTLSDAFFIVEPDVEVELNITRNFRIGIGGAFRFISGLDLQGVTNSDIGGPNARLTFKFGSF